MKPDALVARRKTFFPLILKSERIEPALYIMNPQKTETAALSSSHSAYQNTPGTAQSSGTSREDGSSQPDRPASEDNSTLDATIEDGKEVAESKDQSLHSSNEKNAVLKDIEKGLPVGEQPKTEAPKDLNLVCANFST